MEGHQESIVSKKGAVEVSHGTHGKIYSLIQYLLSPVIDCQLNSGQKYCVAMNNYFTLPKVVAMLRSYGIGCVGTARFRPGWPSKNIKEIDEKRVDFNELLWSVDKYGTLLVRWMDNGLVFIVSTVHSVEQIRKRARKRPRATVRNKRHVDRVWGNKGKLFLHLIISSKTINADTYHLALHLVGKVKLWIPRIIDDYNHWMCGVDLADTIIQTFNEKEVGHQCFYYCYP